MSTGVFLESQCQHCMSRVVGGGSQGVGGKDGESTVRSLGLDNQGCELPGARGVGSVGVADPP